MSLAGTQAYSYQENTNMEDLLSHVLSIVCCQFLGLSKLTALGSTQTAMSCGAPQDVDAADAIVESVLWTSLNGISCIYNLCMAS